MIKSTLDKIMLPFPDKGDRAVWIYVPEHDEGDKLPVIYMTDGQNLFHDDDTPYGCWEVIPAVEAEMKNGEKGVVIVGIDNGNEWRENELTPSEMGEAARAEFLSTYTASEGEIYESFLFEVVKPYVEKNYPVSNLKKDTAFCGSSMGGLYAFYMAVKHSGIFNVSGVFSPATLLFERDVLRTWITPRISADMPYLYIYTGAGDDLENLIWQGTEELYDLLIELGYPMENMNEVVLIENPHNEKAWAQIFPDFLHTFYAKMKE